MEKKRRASDLDLDRLLERAQRGDAEAWGKIVEQLKGVVYAVPYRHGFKEEDVADVFVTCFEKLHRNLDRMKNGWGLPHYLVMTAAEECQRLERIYNQLPFASLDEMMIDEERNVEEEVLWLDEVRRAREVFNKMHRRCQDLLRGLYGSDPLSYAELAARLGLAIGGIGPNRARCLERLREMLEEEGFFE